MVKGNKAPTEPETKGKQMHMHKGISGITIAGLFVVLIIFTIGLYPAMQSAMDSATLDPFSMQMMYLVPMGFFVAILVGILFYAFSGRDRLGAQ